jgi:hypothetical protein
MHLSDFVKSFHLLNKLIAKDETKRNESLLYLNFEWKDPALDAQRVENPGEGVAQIFAWGVKAFQKKLCQESTQF